MKRRLLAVPVILPCLGFLQAQEPEEIVVIGVVPSGATQELGKIPYPVQTSTAADLQRQNELSLADYLEQGFASVSRNDAQNNPLQSDLQYRGFTASPLLGLSQGLAVYQNGVRINEPLGDTVNWDLLPQSAIASVTLSGGANPLFGLNSLGGALAIRMKDGFTFQRTELELSTGSFGRQMAGFQIGGQLGEFAYYGNLDYFEEDGWRDYSGSEAFNAYGSLGWQDENTRISLNYQFADTDLTGNGASPAELLEISRAAIFTGPDITANKLHMLSLDFASQLTATSSVSGNLFYRRNETSAFNGDGSEFAICEFDAGDSLIEGIEEDDLKELGLDDDDVCEGQFADADALEEFLQQTALAAGEDEVFNLEQFDADDISGTGILADDAINNISRRQQDSYGGELQWSSSLTTFGFDSQVILGGAYFNGESQFDSVLELSEIDPLTRITSGLGTGSFVDEAATAITTLTESASLYASNTMDISDGIAVTLSARINHTNVELQDRSGQRPELNGEHQFTRINPALGATWQINANHNLYGNISRSSRAPTPIELACNEGVFDLAVYYAIERGEDPDDIDFECRLPNAFLADPPLKDVKARSIELGSRGMIGEIAYNIGLFHTSNRDDILFQTTGRQTGLFANVDETRRQGLETSFTGNWQAMHWRLNYSYIIAEFADDFTVLSPNHDFANDEGEIQVNRGDAIPGIPRNQLKLIANYSYNEQLSFGIDIVSHGKQHLRGDESNQLAAIDGYTMLNLRAQYRLNEQLQFFARIDNVLDSDYETFGLLGEEPGELEVPIIEDLSRPVFLGAAAPRAAFIGLRLEL